MRKQTVGKVRRVEKVASWSESELLRFTLDVLKHSGLVHWRMPVSGVPRSIGKKMVMMKSPVSGFPDVCGLTHEGTFWGLELKTIKGIVSPNQTEVHDRLRGSNAFVAVSRTPEEVITFLASMGACIKN